MHKTRCCHRATLRSRGEFRTIVDLLSVRANKISNNPQHESREAYLYIVYPPGSKTGPFQTGPFSCTLSRLTAPQFERATRIIETVTALALQKNRSKNGGRAAYLTETGSECLFSLFKLYSAPCFRRVSHSDPVSGSSPFSASMFPKQHVKSGFPCLATVFRQNCEFANALGSALPGYALHDGRAILQMCLAFEDQRAVLEVAHDHHDRATIGDPGLLPLLADGIVAQDAVADQSVGLLIESMNCATLGDGVDMAIAAPATGVEREP